MRAISQICLFILFVNCIYAQSSLQDGLKFLEKKEYERAREAFEAVLKNDNANAEAHAALARVLMAYDRDYDKAEEHLEKAVELKDDNAGYHYFLGNVYGMQAQRAGFFSKISYAKKTKSEFFRAVELDPENIGFREALMTYYLMAPGIIGGSVEKAREQAKEMLQRNACSGHLAYARIALYEKNPGLAEQELRQATQAEPKNWRPYHRLGYIYVEQRRYDEAIVQFKQYVALAPEDANSYDSLGEGYFTKGETDAAIIQFQKALSINPKFSSSLYNLGRSYEKKNLKNEALSNYRKYLDTEPEGQYTDEVKKKVEDLAH
jgi:tetratricopeptide (TPR) repeat protein